VLDYVELRFMLEGLCMIVFLLFIILVIKNNKKELKKFLTELLKIDEEDD